MGFRLKIRAWFSVYFILRIAPNLKSCEIVTPLFSFDFSDGNPTWSNRGLPIRKAFGWGLYTYPLLPWNIDWDGGPLFKWGYRNMRYSR